MFVCQMIGGVILVALFLLINNRVDRFEVMRSEVDETEKGAFQFSDSSHLDTIRPEDVIALEEGIIYFGKETCPQCTTLESYLVKCFASLEEDFRIYYFNTNTWREDVLFDDVLKKYHVNGVPYIIYIKDGAVFQVLQISDLDDERQSLEEIKHFFLYYEV